MNRRRFLELLGAATLGSGVAYSFPSVISCKNISSNVQGTSASISFSTCNNSLNDLFKIMDDDLKDAMKTLTVALHKELYRNPINVRLFDRFGFPEFINNV